MTVYENLLGMLKDAEELKAMAEAKGDKAKAAMWGRKVAEHKAEIAKFG